MREMFLRLNENGSNQYESTRFPYMKIVPNLEVFSPYRNCVGITTTI